MHRKRMQTTPLNVTKMQTELSLMLHKQDERKIFACQSNTDTTQLDIAYECVTPG
jgi:hypothetical protein